MLPDKLTVAVCRTAQLDGSGTFWSDRMFSASLRFFLFCPAELLAFAVLFTGLCLVSPVAASDDDDSAVSDDDDSAVSDDDDSAISDDDDSAISDDDNSAESVENGTDSGSSSATQGAAQAAGDQAGCSCGSSLAEGNGSPVAVGWLLLAATAQFYRRRRLGGLAPSSSRAESTERFNVFGLREHVE